MKLTLCCLLFLTTSISIAQLSGMTKQETIDAIKSYYDSFKTGSYVYAEENGISKPGYDNYTKFTENYIVEIKDCNFKITYDVYDVPNDKIENTTTIEFNLDEIKNISKGKNEELKYKDKSKETLNRNMQFQMLKNRTIKVIKKYEKTTFTKDVNHFYIKIYPNYDAFPNQKQPNFKEILIVNYFNQLIGLCKN